MFEMEKDTTRSAFGRTVLAMAEQDEKIIAVCGDSAASMGLVKMANAMPDRVINVGIAEQNAMDVAAGLAASGLTSVISGFAPFMTLRAGEQLRTFVCYPNLNVKVAGGMSGLSAAAEGVTHQGLEDVGVLRTFPNIVITAPADAAATEVITRAIMEHEGPTYIRLHKGPVYKVFDKETYKFEIGKANLLSDGDDCTIIASGAVVCRAIEAGEQLKAEGVNVRVLEMPCIKPLDNEAVIKAAKETGAIVTVEDHQVIGGLGSAVSECLCESFPAPVKRLGVQDVFTQSGDHYELLDKYGMSVSDIVAAVKEIKTKK